MLPVFFREIFTTNRLYQYVAGIVVLFVLGYFFDIVFLLAKIILLVFFLLMVIDLFLLFFTNRKILELARELPEKLSNGDENVVSIDIRNIHLFPISAKVIDEIPHQFQIRNFEMKLDLKPQEEKRLTYTLRPLERGEYNFGRTHVFVTNRIGFVCRRISFGEKNSIVPVYPSFMKMRKYELLAISNRLVELGVKRIRRLGVHSEFDQIKSYIKGDNYKTINWKATAKKSALMVNQFQDERSQQVYNLIDMGRLMQLPFNGMSLLDYSINSSLIIANTALGKDDKTGIITFNKTIDTFLPAERKNRTIAKILEILYKQETRFFESDYGLLAAFIGRHIHHRSLLVLYTNFETLASLSRQLNYLQNMARHHLLLVVIFENSGIHDIANRSVKSVEDIYIQTIAGKFIHDKRLIARELNKHGILSILTQPENLSVALINKYLEIKDMGLL